MQGSGERTRGILGGKTERERGEGEAACCITQSRSTTARMALTGWGSVKRGLASVCMCGREGGEERQTRGESYPGMEQFVTLEWLLSYTGGPLIAGEFSGRRVGNREGLGVAERGSEVTAYSSPGSVSVSRADGPAERERERVGEGGRRPRRGWSESLVLAKAPFSSACL